MSTIEKALAKQKKAAQDNKSNIEAQDISLKESNDATSAEIPHQIKDTQTALKSSTSTKTSRANKEAIILNGEHLTERGFIFSANSAHHIQEEFRHIKRKLINNAFGAAAKTLKHSNLIMVSSSNPNEGKTFISINLALSIALEQDKTVLLVDADVLRPSIHRELEFESKQGLLEYLLDEVPSLSDVIYNTSIDNLKLIPAGKPHHLTNELLASAKMASLAEELAQRYPDRIVIFDCPPILGVTETPVLSSLVGQAVVVVEESKTKLDSVKKAVAQLNEDIAVGFVMNKTIRSKKDEYGYYGYGYGKKS
ncbi:XrtA-associated tyrosine autokinase [Colwellia sp. 6_MG-2023]|uniref:XrtA-associated tyrosine autokinase n=1 Tax=Colwellia sp. 6_MG-2023 TaxID=3062676 RepID=UPI0026E33989|nr:XrtA-associated tyrosine autokinase [Colwellia sp. 6_MG-2023]MDO6487723.1 XrtA-associated tyrosine autokinase [Colwellia sp. 6_MG-2023]